jgi:ubiquitin carboxyl-terminal hydrolase 4/11/15
MNSALQCLSNVPELTEYFLSTRVQEEINSANVLGTGGKLAKAYQDLIREMWSGNASSVKPYHFKCVIGQFAPRFNGYAQQDAQELMAFLLDGLHEDLNRIFKKPYIEEKESDGRPDHVVADEAWKDYKKRNDSIVVDLMHGQLKSTVECNKCNKVSIKFDPFCFLSVPVPTKERQVRSLIIIYYDEMWHKV